MPQPRKGKRILGPYEHPYGWQIIVVDAKGERDPVYFAEEEKARAVARDMRRELGESADKNVDEAIDAYELYLRDEKGNKQKSVDETIRRLRLFFVKVLDVLLAKLERSQAATSYKNLRERVITIGKGENAKKRLLSVDTHRNILLEARSFLRWCKDEKRWVRFNALDEVKGQGKRNHGKPQLRVDEARLWLAKALALAGRGDQGAVGAMMTLLMALSGKEITMRKVRDLDDAGTILWIEDAKTEKREGQVAVPPLLEPFLRRLTEGRSAEEYLFPARGGMPHWRDWPRKNVQRICEASGVPLVSGHGMRGLHSTLAFERGMTGRVVAEGLRHEDESTTRRSYAKREAVRKGDQQRLFEVLSGQPRQSRRSSSRRRRRPERDGNEDPGEGGG